MIFLGVLLGVIGILAGNGTGFENLEMPRYSAVPLFIGYLLIGLWTVLTFHQRRERSLQPAQWFLLAALFWFPWIFSTARLVSAGLMPQVGSSRRRSRGSEMIAIPISRSATSPYDNVPA